MAPRSIEEISLLRDLRDADASPAKTVASAHLRFFNAIFPYLRLIRFYLHQNFAIVVFGSLFFEGNHYGGDDLNLSSRLPDLLALYFSFNVCLYGGIYTVNAVTDADEDKEHPTKRFRPVPSGDVSKTAALLFAFSLWTMAFTSSFLYFGSTRFFAIYCVFISLNLAYSVIFRNVKYSRFFTAGLTSPTRLHLGSMLSHSSVPVPCFVMAYLFMVNVQVSKIRAERGEYKSSSNGFAPGVVEGICVVGTLIAVAVHYPNHAPFLVTVVLSNMVYIALPMVSSSACAILLGADVKSKKAN